MFGEFGNPGYPHFLLIGYGPSTSEAEKYNDEQFAAGSNWRQQSTVCVIKLYLIEMKKSAYAVNRAVIGTVIAGK